MSDFKRTQNFVDKSVQGGLVRRIFFHWVAFFFVTGLSVLAIKTMLGDPAVSFSERFQGELRDFVTLSVVFAAIFPAFMLDTIRFSNRFVGPVKRLRKHLIELGQTGKTSEIKFRDNDFWQEIANEFNHLNDRFKSQQQEIATLKSQLNCDAGELQNV